MSCCDHCKETGELFDHTKAKSELRSYRKKGPPTKSTRLLIDALKTLALRGKTLLDIGGGVGMIPFELLDAGVSEATLVEASPAYLETAEKEARRREYGGQMSFKYGDFVERASELPNADLVTLDRVFCCYPHLQRLVEASTAKASRWYGVVYPKEAWYNQVIGGVADVYCWARGMDFRLYIHSGVDDAIREKGFVPFYRINTVLWRVALYEREEAT